MKRMSSGVERPAMDGRAGALLQGRLLASPSTALSTCDETHVE
jgi:hypothetical protein